MKGLGNNQAFIKYQELCSKLRKMEEKLSNGNLSKEEEKKLRFAIKSIQKGTEKARLQIAGH